MADSEVLTTPSALFNTCFFSVLALSRFARELCALGGVLVLLSGAPMMPSVYFSMTAKIPTTGAFFFGPFFFFFSSYWSLFMS